MLSSLINFWRLWVEVSYCDYLILFLILPIFALHIWGYTAAATAAKSLQSCPTLCDPIDGSPPGSTILGNLQARTLEVGCHFLLQCMKVKSQSEFAQLCPTLSDPWTAAYQAPPSMGFSRQEYCSGVPLPSPWGYTAAAKSLQSCPTLCDPRGGSPPGSPVPVILQARTLEWVAISFDHTSLVDLAIL